jgi:cytochrome c553
MKFRIGTAVAASLAMLASLPALGQDAATVYRTKCAICHGDHAQGNPGLSAPRIAGSAKVVAVLTQDGDAKGLHFKQAKNLTPDQITALAAFVKALK